MEIRVDLILVILKSFWTLSIRSEQVVTHNLTRDIVRISATITCSVLISVVRIRVINVMAVKKEAVE